MLLDYKAASPVVDLQNCLGPQIAQLARRGAGD